jgi:F0F1-type ATP synthase membrane subunit b/b'
MANTTTHKAQDAISGAAHQAKGAVSSGAEKVKDTAQGGIDKARDLASTGVEKARDLANTGYEKAKDAAQAGWDKAKDAAQGAGQMAENATSRVGGGMESLAGTIRDKAPHEGMIGAAASTVADTLERGGRYIREEGLSGIGGDLTDTIRRNPIPSVLVGVALGFLLARATRS